MAETERVSSFVTQAKHGFSRGQCVRFDGNNWVISPIGVAGCGLVGSLRDANTFEFVQLGLLEDLDSLTPGAAYYTSASGALTLTPNGPAVGIAYDTRTIFIQPVAQAIASLDLSGFVTVSQLNASISSEVVRANAAYLEESQASGIGLDILSSLTTRDVREDIEIEPASSTLAYTGTLLTLITDAYGTKTLAYDVNNRLTGVTGTGKYRSKTYAYTGDQLTSITVI